MGLADRPGFGRYHEVLSEARWDGRALARTLLQHLLDALLPEGEVVIVPDDSIERRWGPHIRDRGIYRDPVRSSRGFFVKTSGLRWLSLAVVLPIPWAKRRWALPFLTILAPSQRANAARGRRHKPLTRWAIQAILQTRRWLPERAMTIVGDSSFACLDLIAAVRRHVRLVTRLRLDANLFAPAPPRRPGQRGRKACKGHRRPKLTDVLANPGHALDPGVGERMVWRREPRAGDRLRHRDLVPRRPAAGADPLGAGARSRRPTGAAGLPQHQPRRQTGGDPRPLRLALADRDHVPGWSRKADPPPSSRRRDPAAVVRPGHPADHAGAARTV